MKKIPYTVQLIRLYGLLVAVVASLVEADYQLEVTVHSFSLLRNRCALCYQGNMTETQNQCCDPPMTPGLNGSCDPQCDLLFYYGHGQLDNSNITTVPYPHNQSPINLFDFNKTSFTNFTENITLLFKQFSLFGAIFYMEFWDRDFQVELPNDLIDTLIVDVDIPVGASINHTTYTGRFNNAQVELSFRVVCAENYYGPNCTQFCNDSSCPCNPGFTGEFCETNINDCDGVDCSGIGQCVDGINSFVCQCDLGFTGEFCEMDIDYCEGVNCSGNGTCTQTIGSFSCQCNELFAGPLCEIRIEPCKDEVDCGSNGQCVVKMDTYTCDCDPGFTGEACEQQMMSVCENVSCSGNGHCEDEVMMSRCICESGYTGAECGATIDVDCVEMNCEDRSDITLIIAGVLVLTLMAIIAAVAIVIFFLHRKQGGRTTVVDTNPEMDGHYGVSMVQFNATCDHNTDQQNHQVEPNYDRINTEYDVMGYYTTRVQGGPPRPGVDINVNDGRSEHEYEPVATGNDGQDRQMNVEHCYADVHVAGTQNTAGNTHC